MTMFWHFPMKLLSDSREYLNDCLDACGKNICHYALVALECISLMDSSIKWLDIFLHVLLFVVFGDLLQNLGSILLLLDISLYTPDLRWICKDWMKGKLLKRDREVGLLHRSLRRDQYAARNQLEQVEQSVVRVFQLRHFSECTILARRVFHYIHLLLVLVQTIHYIVASGTLKLFLILMLQGYYRRYEQAYG